jgi:tungstate transport system ATP-binding protein
VRELVCELPIDFAAVGYAAGQTAILEGISRRLDRGEPTALIGPNGAGKTTLLRLAMGLNQPSRGLITRGGARGGPLVRRAFVFQKPAMLRRSAAGNVAFALRAARRAADWPTIEALLARVGLSECAMRPPFRRRATAPGARPRIGAQSRGTVPRRANRQPRPSGTKADEDVILGIAACGVKVVFSTHDLGQARRLAADVLLLVGGRIVERAPAQSFFACPASDAGAQFVRGGLAVCAHRRPGHGAGARDRPRGDADVLFDHAKKKERFVAEGFGVKRFDVIDNDFTRVGPPPTPPDSTAAMTWSRRRATRRRLRQGARLSAPPRSARGAPSLWRKIRLPRARRAILALLV